MEKPLSVELKIKSLSDSVGDPALVADELLKQWYRKELSLDDQKAVGQFLLLFGFGAALANQLSHQIKESAAVPWDLVAQLITNSGHPTTKQNWDDLFWAASEQKQELQFTSHLAIYSQDPRFEKIRKAVFAEKLVSDAKTKEKLLDDLDVARQDRLWDQVNEIIEKIEALFPNSPDVVKLKSDFATRKAKESLDKYSSNQNEWIEQVERKINFETKEDLKIVSAAIPELLKQIQTPQMAIDMAVGLHMMGASEAALTVLKKSTDQESSMWVEIEILLECHRFIDVLEKTDQVSKLNIGHDSEIAAHYARARALYGLNKLEPAIELLETIVKLRPNYRSCHSLLLEWKAQLK